MTKANLAWFAFVFSSTLLFIVQVSHVWEFIEVKEVITPFWRSRS